MKDSYHKDNAPLPLQGLARACQESHGVGGREIESQTQTEGYSKPTSSITHAGVQGRPCELETSIRPRCPSCPLFFLLSWRKCCSQGFFVSKFLGSYEVVRCWSRSINHPQTEGVFFLPGGSGRLHATVVSHVSHVMPSSWPALKK